MNLTIHNAPVGSRIKFLEELVPYRVRARSERYLVCTKPFNLRKTVLYTVVDLVEQVRGTENLIFGVGAETDDDCTQMIARLSGTGAELEFQTEVSHRNRVQLRVSWVRAPQPEKRTPRRCVPTG